ncbi:MAG: UDP-N-acetylglucosamine 2-epimerase (non-hydrolyzing) [Verrucomicrobiota bacterium]
MARKLIHLIAGARPNFMKIAPLVRAIQAHGGFYFRIVHTGQHYDRSMSAVFFEELGIPQPDHHLGCGGGSHAQQTAKIMVAYENLCNDERPDVVVVVGDVNSTLACSIVAKKFHIPVAHVEAGLRSGDRTMPEEINRLVTDAIADLFFVTEPSGVEHLRCEGQPAKSIHYVGHVMVDNVIYQKRLLDAVPLTAGVSVEFKRRHGEYGVVTMHRPSNVDDPATLNRLTDALRRLSMVLPLAFPVHPRTRANLAKFGIDPGPRILLLEPMAYMDFLNLWKGAKMVLTDSGGLQEETTALGVPCITLRENTERPITINEGTNVLAGTDPEVILSEAHRVLDGKAKAGARPMLWDGAAAERIVAVLAESFPAAIA